MAFATTRNAVPLPIAAVPVMEADEFRRDVLAAIDAGGRLLLLIGLPGNGQATRLLAAIADDARGEILVASAVVADAYPALTPDCPAAHHFEREIREQYGIEPQGHPWLKPVRFPPGGPAIGDAEFFSVSGAEIHEVAVGPVHAGVIEPGHFRFNCHGERVIHLEISLGYQHRGIERALRGGPDRRSLYLAETIAGDTTAGHATAYCQLLEGLAGSECSPRANALRAAAIELERIANHIGDLGALAGDVGFLPVASYCGRLRGDVLNLTAELCGSRLGRGWIRPGGVSRDMSSETRRELRQRLAAAERDMRNAVDLLWKSSSTRSRFDLDARRDFRAAVYRDRRPAVAVGETGDVFARAQQRWREIENSVAFLTQVLEDPGEGPAVSAIGPLAANALVLSLVEAWRGEIVHLAATDAAGRFSHYKIVDPSFRNWFALGFAMRGQPIMDFPLCNKSFNLSYCGHDL